MSDKSFVPCKKCGHPKNKHGISYNVCWKCPVQEYNNVGYCAFERIKNLEYLEWCYNQDKEKIK